jgi:hypothetical protein
MKLVLIKYFKAPAGGIGFHLKTLLLTEWEKYLQKENKTVLACKTHRELGSLNRPPQSGPNI